MDDLVKQKSIFKGPAKWVLVAACGLLTALVITAGVYFELGQDSTTSLPAEQIQRTVVE